MTKTLYLHIGTFKTGTSSLQRFLHENRDWLQEQGCLVPGSRPRDHALLAQSIAKDFAGFHPPQWQSVSNHETLWQHFHEEIRRSDCPVVLVSSEHFCDLAHENCRQQTDTMMHWLAKQLGGLDVRVVCYLRSLGSYTKSFYKELVKVTKEHRTMVAQLDRLIARRSIHVSPTAYLDRYAEHFGGDSLILRQYDRRTLTNGNTIDDFLELIGLPPQSEDRTNREYNPSLPDGLVDAKRKFNALVNGSVFDTHRVRQDMARASTPAFKRPSDDGGQAVRDALQREHQAVAERYGLDLGEVDDPFSRTRRTQVVDSIRFFMSVLSKGVRAVPRKFFSALSRAR